MNHGLDLQREKLEQSEKDWQFGAFSAPSLVSIPEKLRKQYLPMGETQFNSKTDFGDCATRAPINYAEALFTYWYQGTMLPENKKWLEDNGYIQDGKVVLSDRFIAILSGTTRAGNSLKAPLDAIRLNGLIPKSMLPKEDWMVWVDYMDRSKITQKMLELGKEFKRRFPMNYEQVQEAFFGDLLDDEMIVVAGHAWPVPVDGVYPRVVADLNHAWLLWGIPKYQAFDNYQDTGGSFFKNLAPDYDFWEYGYRLYISAERTDIHFFAKNMFFGADDPEVAYLQKALVSLGYQIPHAVTNYYGNETRVALAAFQKANNIADNGMNFGPRTRLALNQALNTDIGFAASLVLIIRTFLGI